MYGHLIEQIVIVGGSFEGITTTSTFQEYNTGSAMGSWIVDGTAFIVNENSPPADPNAPWRSIKYSTKTPSDLPYSCMLQTNGQLTNGQQLTASIQTTFDGLVIGSCYSASFYTALRLIPPQKRKPTTFNVNLGGISVYSKVPSTTSWVPATTSTITAVSTSVTLEFEISSRLEKAGDLGLDAITLSNVACPTGTYILL
jgi:hypothetical protein